MASRIFLSLALAAFGGAVIGGVIGFCAMPAVDLFPTVRSQMDGIEIVLLPFLGAIGGALAGPLGLGSAFISRKVRSPLTALLSSVIGGSFAALALCIILYGLINPPGDESLWTSMKVLIAVEAIVAFVAGTLGGYLGHRLIER